VGFAVCSGMQVSFFLTTGTGTSRRANAVIEACTGNREAGWVNVELPWAYTHTHTHTGHKWEAPQLGGLVSERQRSG